MPVNPFTARSGIDPKVFIGRGEELDFFLNDRLDSAIQGKCQHYVITGMWGIGKTVLLRQMEPWYKIATPRKEVRQGRSFNPDEFAIHLEQVIGRTAPEDYSDPNKFFRRTCFTRALIEHAGMVLRRLSGETANTAPVMTLITQFGGGKTHTLTALYHLVTNGAKADEYDGISELTKKSGISAVPEAKVAAFVGNACDPQEDRETPWIDIARQLAGENGVKELGAAAKTTPPGTEALNRVFNAANGPVLLLFDEVLNFLNRHRFMAEPFHAFIQNLTVATTGTTHGAAVISLPRSQVEMTDWDLKWQDRITKVVRRVAKDLIANDESEISEVVRRRLFEDIGSDRVRRNVSKAYADWCFERRAQLPTEWTAVDSATTEVKAKEYLRNRFEVWNRFGTKILPKLRSGSDLKIGVDFSVSMEKSVAQSFEIELKQILDDMGLSDRVKIEPSD